MGLLRPVEKEMGYLKAGIFGLESTGKTYLAVTLAMGVAKQTGRKKIAFYDTENGAGYAKDRVKNAGLQFDSHKSRSFRDLCDIVLEAERDQYGCLIVDSITHPWEDLKKAYLKSSGRSRLGIDGIQLVKGQWSEFTDLFLNSKLNIVLCGRLGNIFEEEEDEDGAKDLVKVGTKMKVEGDMGYEPHLLLEMAKAKHAPKPGKGKVKKGEFRKSKGIQFRCFVWKDKNMDPKTSLTGKEFINPKFEDFKNHLDFIELGSDRHVGFHNEQDTSELFDRPDRSWEKMQRRRRILIDELEAVLIKSGMAGTSNEAKLKRVQTLERFFGQSSRTWIEEEMPIKDLAAAITELRVYLFPPTSAKNGDAEVADEKKVAPSSAQGKALTAD